MSRFFLFLSLLSLVIGMLYNIQEFLIASIVFSVVNISSFLTKKASEGQLKNSHSCPPHLWAYTETYAILCKRCGAKPNTFTD